MNNKIVFLILFTFICLSCKARKDSIMITDNYVKAKNVGVQESYDDKNSTEPDLLTKEEKKYFASLLNVPENLIDDKNLTNHKLYAFTREWLGTPYVYGGHSKEGIDCSAFMQVLYVEVYDRLLARTAAEMAIDNNNISQFKSQSGLQEGDLIFFRTGDERIATHVGVYLKNGKFLSATVSKGVTIASLDEPFWKRNYLICGRLKNIADE